MLRDRDWAWKIFERPNPSSPKQSDHPPISAVKTECAEYASHTGHRPFSILQGLKKTNDIIIQPHRSSRFRFAHRPRVV